ncbi:uncharacterized protein LOC128261317 [Drosophila gunungcola]|uniref:Kazal-like domain-containing protein n=1 Tax=Drosophila gunungcola TaxID=103775 RepID=A0A9P9Z0V7_9MUSC|nr:uncharacterized protein LOC108140607 [Drosophila elegans]XP_052850916.1 uncharacterized protein LOC128261317 [Drosophila gunungcola]KAI8046453.1 hypothetical protein M5D96_002663 [Drosophila gunungcola]
MKLIAVLLAVALFALSLVQCLSLPDPSTKCGMECDTQEYGAICAADDKGSTKTYRNLCIMKTENCLQNANFQKISEKECP